MSSRPVGAGREAGRPTGRPAPATRPDRAGGAAKRPASRAGRKPAACGLAATGLLVWQCVDFLYADIGGPTTVLTATLLGLAAWWALAPATATAAPQARARTRTHPARPQLRRRNEEHHR